MILRSSKPDKPVIEISSLADAVSDKRKLGIFRDCFVMEISLPPYLDKQYKSGKEEYNPYRLECTCDYNKRARAEYRGNDIRKICKHIYSRLAKNEHTLLLPPIDIMLRQQLKRGPECLIKNRGDLYTGYIKNSVWVSVYLEEGETWKTYLYNTERKVFAYGITPGKNFVIK